MSTKINKITKNNLFYMRLAIEQAKVNLGSTKTNPSVGCVVEKNGSIISSGRTSLGGRPHAEFNALNKNINFRNSNLYTTLEPCTHYGLTPPCVDIIIKKKIKNVFFSLIDPDIRTKNKALSKLNRNKIKVKKGILKDVTKKLYKSYFLKKEKFLPVVDAKIAISKDYFTINKKTKWITNRVSLVRSHLIRSWYDCIISTSKSINSDNSLLNCRIRGLEKKSPSLIILDRNLRLKKNLSFFKIPNRKIYLFTIKQNKNKEKVFKKYGIKVIRLKKMNNKKDYMHIFSKLCSLGFSKILVESGLTFLSFILKEKLINNLYIFKAKNYLRQNGKNFCKNNLIKEINLNNKNKVKVNLLGDTLYNIRFK